MRWEGLSIDEDATRQLPGYREPATVRTFDAPEAMDIRFYEVRAKSALNKVPNTSRMPFRWTVNPYRGCTHACTYCLAGDTPILMADRTAKPLAELRPGDRVYGTELRGAQRRYVVTEVLDHWATLTPAHRLTLDDGTQLVASADHRFLTRRGWKQVTGNEPGGPRRRLSASDQLLGPGRAKAVEGGAVEPGAKLWVSTIEPLGEERVLFDITTGTGDFIAAGVVSHNCFARPTHKYLDLSPGRDFEREIVVKVNAPEALRDTDTPCSVLTKSPLLLRDLPLLEELAERVGFTASLSIPTLDEKAWRATEPHTPHPRARLEAVAELNRAGVPTGILVAPLMPGINDSPSQIDEILELATEAGATNAAGLCLHLRGEVREIFFDWLRHSRPDLIPRYEELYERGAYAPKAERERISRLVRYEPPPGTRRRTFRRAAPEDRASAASRARRSEPPPEQPSLF